jgi:hypothetical protein
MVGRSSGDCGVIRQTTRKETVTMQNVERGQDSQDIQRTTPGLQLWKLLGFMLAALLAFYLFMFLRYRPYDIDNPWFLSFSYGRFVEHVTTDQFMNVRFPGGMDGTQYFGLLAASVQYAVGLLAGWREWPIEILSTVCVVLSLLLWSLQLRRLGYSNKFVLSFVLIAGLCEPFLAVAESFRYEYMSVLLISAGLALVAYRRIMPGLFLVAIAAEVEPMAVLGLIPAGILAYSVCKDRWSVTWRLAAVIAAVAGICVWLHPNLTHLHELSEAQSGASITYGGIARAYFFERRRHLPELVLFVCAGWFYWRRRRTVRSHYLGISAGALGCVSLLTPHGNVAYMVFIYPFLIGMALDAFETSSRFGWVALLWAIYLLPQYMWLAYTNRNLGYRERDFAEVSNTIENAAREIGVGPDDLRVYGDYGLWLAHPHFYRAASPNTLQFANEADLFVCYQAPPSSGKMLANDMLYCPDIRRHFPLTLISKTLVRGNTLYLYAKGQK